MIVMQEKNEVLKHLSLAYYANQMSVYFKLESIIAQSIHYFITRNNLKSVTLLQIFERSTVISEILQNEFLNKNLTVEPEDVENQMNEAVKRNWYIRNSDGSFSMQSDDLSLQYHSFFKNLSQAYIDAYFVVALTLNEMMEGRHVIEQTKLVNEIHIAVQEIYNKGGIRFLSSCVHEVLTTAIRRFSQLGVCLSQSYSQETGAKVTYIQMPRSNAQGLETYLSVLAGCSSRDYRSQPLIDREVSQVVRRLQTPLARL